MNKITSPLFILSIILCFQSLSAQSTIRGSIQNEHGEPLEFATIFVNENGKGAIANVEGNYEIRLKPGKYTLIFQYLGYEARITEVETKPGLLELNVVLQPQAYELNEVQIVAGQEDPAYTVMRKAIAKADYHRNQLNAYETTVYIKGSGRLKNVPKILRSQIEKEGIDSTMAFVTESVSRYEYQRPNKYKETVISIRKQGDDNNTSPNSYFKGSFYDDDNDGAISPLSRKAFAYYKFKLEGYYEDRGYNVNKIKVTPRSRGENVYEGYIYILEDYWSIHSLKLKSYYLGFENRIEQIYAPLLQNVWMPVSFKFDIEGKILGFLFEYKYLATASDYKIEVNPDLDVDFSVIDEKLNKELAADLEKIQNQKNDGIQDKLEMGEEMTSKDLRKLMRIYEKEERKKKKEPEVISERQFEIDSLAYKKDSTYWALVRPIPLTKYEVKGYALSDSLSRVETEKEEGKPAAKFSFGDVFTGYKFKTGDQTSFSFASPLLGIRFNLVEGFSLHETFTFRRKGEKTKNFEARARPRYAFARKTLTGTAGFSFSVGKKIKEQNVVSVELGGTNNNGTTFLAEGKMLEFELEGGRYVFQYNESKPIDEILSMTENLFRERNYIRLYEKDFLKYAVTRLKGKWNFKAGLEWANRYSLQNISNQTWYTKDDRSYASNIPQNEEVILPLSGGEKAFIISGVIEGRPWQKYTRRNGKKIVVNNSSPLFRLQFRGAAPVDFLNTSAQFSTLDFTVRYNFKIGVRSNIQVKLNTGIFLNNKKMAFTDFKHFAGNQLSFTTADPLGSFRLLEYYKYSTQDKYLSANIHYGFRKFLVTQLPAVWMLGMRENLFVNYLATPTSQNYFELGYSLDKIFRFFRVEVAASFQDGQYKDFGVLIGISTEIGSAVSFGG